MNWEAYPNPIPRDQWAGPGNRRKPAPHTQGLTQRCTVDAALTAMEWQWASQTGESIRLDVIELFGRFSGGQGGIDFGSLVPEIENNGVKAVGSPGVYRAEWWTCPDFDSAYSAASQLTAGVTSLAWYTGNRAGPDNWMLEGPHFLNAGGHMIFWYAPAARIAPPPSNQPEFGLWCMQSQGAFNPRGGQRVVISETQLKGCPFYACRSVTRSES